MMNVYNMISEMLSGHPNIDMLITRPYLYSYVSNDELDDIKVSGINTKDNKIWALFIRLPEDQYAEYLKTHTAIRLITSKLFKIADQKINMRVVNLDFDDSSIGESDIEKILENSSDKIRSMLLKGVAISSLPRVDVEYSGESLPVFTFRILDN